jgi:hypothetical protein
MNDLNDLAIITTYFNYCNYKSLRNNYDRFCKQIDSFGLHLHTFEIAYLDTNFYSDSPYKFRTNSVLWHKENLINIAAQILPDKYKYIAWIDADIEFTDIKHFYELRGKLENYPLVQLFNKVVRQDYRGLPNLVGSSYPYWVENKDKSNSKSLAMCTSGYAWGAQRELVKDFGIYDLDVLGVGDILLPLAAYGWWNDDAIKTYPEDVQKQILVWGKEFWLNVQGSVGYIDRPIQHWWHGDETARNYDTKKFILYLYDFNPNIDIVKNDLGLLEWTGYNPLLEEAVKKYFISRKEDER